MRIERNIYETRVSPFLDRVDSEKAHHAAIRLLHLAEKYPCTLSLIERFAYKSNH